jgi:hypothetical protein
MAAGPLPNFLIIGAMRSGTTSLAHYLRSHPDVFVPEAKELHFFDRRFDRGLDWYREQFTDAGDASAIGEATPNYLYEPDAADRIADVLPEAKLIAILRDPADRAWSHYWHHRARGSESLEFEAAIAAEDERRAATPDNPGWYAYVDRGRYLPQLERFTARFDRSSLLVLLFDDLVGQPDTVYRDVCSFLGVGPDTVPPDLGRVVNAMTGFRSLGVRRLTRRWPKRARDAVGRLNTRRIRPPAMSPQQRSAVQSRLHADTSALGAWLGRDLRSWAGEA